jgi:hypothetical protein
MKIRNKISAASFFLFVSLIVPRASQAQPVVLSENGSAVHVGTYDLGADALFGGDGQWLRAGLRMILTEPRVGPEIGLGLEIYQRGDWALLAEMDAGAFGAVVTPGDGMLRLGGTLPVVFSSDHFSVQAGPRLELTGHPRTSAYLARASLMAGLALTSVFPQVWLWGDVGRIVAPTGGITDGMLGLALAFHHPWPESRQPEDTEN